MRSTNTFLPIVECPISAPLLWRSVQAFLQLAQTDARAAAWFDHAEEAEFFADAQQQKLLLTLHCRTQTSPRKDTFALAAEALHANLPELSGATAVRSDPRSGRTLEVLAEWGTQGIAYEAAGESYWVSRGGFFQVNRFLIDAMVRAVCEGRDGSLAWDLFAGVGLFSRVLARNFAQITAVEANPTAANDLRIALRKLGPAHHAIQQTTVDFLRAAVLQRDRPELIVLDPPRAGAGTEACTLLGRLRPAQMVYVSCDPTTLARDLQQLQNAGYGISSVQLIDLFPQTFHIETIVALSLA
jgi:23S rRNA (uracil1939-C5)-methyltransferase